MMTHILRSYSVIIYREYHTNDLHAFTSRLRGHLPILGNKNPNVNIGRNGVKMGKNHDYRLRINLNSYFYAHVHF